MADEPKPTPIMCDMCERKIEFGEPFMRAPTKSGELATACMSCVESVFKETFPTKQ